MLSSSIFAQKVAITSAEKQAFFSDATTKSLAVVDAKIAQTIDEENSFTVSGTDGTGSFKISIIICPTTNKKGEKVELAMLINRQTGEKQVWTETEKAITTIVNGQESVQIKGSPSARGSVGDCLSQYLKPGVTSCVSCTNCIISCSVKSTKALRRACAMKNCSGTCWSCLRNVWGFICCLYN